MATLQAHGGAAAQCVKIESRPERGPDYQLRFSRALCADGTILQKVDSKDPASPYRSKGWDGQGWKVRSKLKAGVPASRTTLETLYPPAAGWDFGQGPAAPTRNARFVMDRDRPAPAVPLAELQASHGPHAPVYRDFKGARPPTVPDGPWRADDEPGHVQGNRDPNGRRDGDALYPKGLEIGLSYSPMTYLQGRDSNGDPATHAALYPVALAFYGDPDGMRAAWVHIGTRWAACFTPRCPEMDPARAYEYGDGPAHRLGVLLERAAPGFKTADDGARYYARALKDG